MNGFGSSRAHSRNYHNEESTAGVRIERTFSLPITRYRTILASGIEPDSVPCSSMPSSLCPGLFPGVTPFRRAGGAHVVPETLSLHIPVVRIAHGTSREPSGLLTLHVPYNGREYCRSQLEAHSFSYKPIPTGKKGNALSCWTLPPMGTTDKLRNYLVIKKEDDPDVLWVYVFFICPEL